MKAAVLLRAVLDPGLERGVSGSLWRLDEPCLAGVHLALSLRGTDGSGQVFGMAAGPGEWEVALREGLAFGLDTVARTWSDALAEADVPAQAAALAGLIDPSTSVVVAGGPASDHGSGLVPAALAELLGWDLVEGVLEARRSEDGILLTLGAPGGRRITARVRPPVVLVAARRAGRAPYPPVARRLAARRATITSSEPVAAPPARLRFDGFGPARPVTRHLLKPAASANAGGRLRSLMSGGASAAAAPGKALQGGGDIASQLADLLVREGFGGRGPGE